MLNSSNVSSSDKKSISIFWFRRDLRLSDNAGLYHALKNETNVLPLFIFDKEILGRLENKSDLRVDLIHQMISGISEQLKEKGNSLFVKFGSPLEVFTELFKNFSIQSVYTNEDYEPSAIERDEKIKKVVSKHGASFHSFKDQVIFQKNEICKDDGLPYAIFTPYMRKWKNKFVDQQTKPFPTEKYFSNFLKTKSFPIPTLESIGFEKTGIKFKSPKLDETIIAAYAKQRDFPAIAGTSRLSFHLRFGTLSIREAVKKAVQLNETWLNELIWREFYMMILYHFPHVTKGSFKKAYDKIPWRNNEAEFEAWCKGETGYPIVDAGMRELNATGFMHNRVRMITASFLVKHLLIDWRWGEAYFAEKLVDFDLSANNGGWQWAASSGCDAAPYFRVFSPDAQTKRFDPQLTYIRKWVSNLDELTYPQPIVDHKFARERVLNTYKKALGNNQE